MKILLINGSPKARFSNTEKILKVLMEGAIDGGADVSTVYLSEKKITPCNGCLTCYLNDLNSCVNKDDFPKILDEFVSADLVVFSTPIYSFSVPAVAKAFFDRFMFGLATLDRVLIDNISNYRIKERYDGKKWRILTVSQGSYDGDDVFKPTIDMYKRLFKNIVNRSNECCFDLIGQITIGMGGFLSFNIFEYLSTF
jgi:multimeric flavodoxin WrbA